MDDPPNLVDRETEARISKFETQTKVLAQQLDSSLQRREFWLKALPAVGGTLLGIAAMATVLISVVVTTNEFNHERELRIEERLDSALDRAMSQSANQRLSGISSLKSFLGADNEERQNLSISSLAHLLATDDDATVRAAVLDVFRSLDPTTVSVGVVNTATNTLVELSRSLVLSQELNRKNVAGTRYPPLRDRDALARGVAQAIGSLVSIGASVRDFSGIYCADCDFAGKDLRGANFDGALLMRADFSGANLDGASFDRADLEGTRFRKASIRKARLTQSRPSRVGRFSTQYGWDRLSDDLVSVGMPDFNCADLTDSDFTGRILFGLVRTNADLIYWANFDPSSFMYAKLDGARLEEIGVFGVDESSRPTLPFTSSSMASSGVHESWEGKNYWAYSADMGVDSRLTESSDDFRESLEGVVLAFQGSTWREAVLSPALRELLHRGLPASDENLDVQSLDDEFWCDLETPIL